MRMFGKELARGLSAYFVDSTAGKVSPWLHQSAAVQVSQVYKGNIYLVGGTFAFYRHTTANTSSAWERFFRREH